MQTHFLNVQPCNLVGRSLLDIKLEPVDRSRRVASIVFSAVLKVNVLATGKCRPAARAATASTWRAARRTASAIA